MLLSWTKTEILLFDTVSQSSSHIVSNICIFVGNSINVLTLKSNPVLCRHPHTIDKEYSIEKYFIPFFYLGYLICTEDWQLHDETPAGYDVQLIFNNTFSHLLVKIIVGEKLNIFCSLLHIIPLSFYSYKSTMNTFFLR